MAANFHAVVVDDSPSDRAMAKKLLETSSFHVTDFASPTKALDFLEKNARSKSNSEKIDLIVTDYSMPPEMTGFDLMMKVHEPSSSVKNIPVVIMSSDDVAGLCLANGAHDFIPKPFRKHHAAKLKIDLEKNMTGAGPSGN